LVKKGSGPKDAALPTNYAVRYLPLKKEKATSEVVASSVSATATHVNVDERGEASIVLFLKRGTEKAVYLGLRGADLVEVADPAVLQPTGDGIAVIGSGSVPVVLRNLHEGRPIRIYLRGSDGRPLKGAALEVAVLGPSIGRNGKVATAR
jgi:hypothetical protein